MAKSTPIHSSELVSEYIKQLEPNLGAAIQYIRQVILETDAEIGEEIKWNAPSFFYSGEMKPFEPKEYKRHIIVMNLHKGRILLVFPSGAKVNDTSGLLEGDYKDGRRTLLFKDIEDAKSKSDQLQTIIKKWLALVEKI